MTKKERLLNAADKLDEAREAMNHGGRHWIKGAYRRWVDKKHKPGQTGYAHKKHAGVDCEYGFCSIGALNYVGAGKVAKAALSEAIIDYGFHYYGNGDTNKIIAFNDRSETEWGDVNRAFRKASSRLRKEAAKL